MKKDEQANVLLSLKNLYRLFTVKDYPVYSTGILREKSKKGLTLVRFWDEYLLYEWKGTTRTSCARKVKKFTRYSLRPWKRLRSSSFWVATPTGQVF